MQLPPPAPRGALTRPAREPDGPPRASRDPCRHCRARPVVDPSRAGRARASRTRRWHPVGRPLSAISTWRKASGSAKSGRPVRWKQCTRAPSERTTRSRAPGPLSAIRLHALERIVVVRTPLVVLVQLRLREQQHRVALVVVEPLGLQDPEGPVLHPPRIISASGVDVDSSEIAQWLDHRERIGARRHLRQRQGTLVVRDRGRWAGAASCGEHRNDRWIETRLGLSSPCCSRSRSRASSRYCRASSNRPRLSKTLARLVSATVISR